MSNPYRIEELDSKSEKLNRNSIIKQIKNYLNSNDGEIQAIYFNSIHKSGANYKAVFGDKDLLLHIIITSLSNWFAALNPHISEEIMYADLFEAFSTIRKKYHNFT